MRGLRLEGSGKKFSLSKNGGESEEEDEDNLTELEDEDNLTELEDEDKHEEAEEEANLDLDFFLIENEESVEDEGQSARSNNLRSALKELKSGNPTRQISAVHQLRKIYSFQDILINEEIARPLIHSLVRDEFPRLQFEAARTLRYMAKDEPSLLTESEVVSHFSNLLNSPNEEVQEQGLRAVAVIADCAVASRDYESITEDIFFNLLPFLYRPKAPFVNFWFALKSVVYIIHCKPEESMIALTPLKEILETGEDLEVLKLACKALLYFSEESDTIESIVGNDIVPCLVDLLFHESPEILLLVMEIMANIVEYGNFQEVISERVLLRLVAIISSGSKRDSISDTARQLHIELCRLLYSIATLRHDDIELAIKTGVISALVGLLAEGEDTIKEEAISAIVSAIGNGSEEQVEFFVDLDCINLLIDQIRPGNSIRTDCCKTGLERMFEFTRQNKHKYPHQFQIAKVRFKSHCSEFPPPKKPSFGFYPSKKLRSG